MPVTFWKFLIIFFCFLKTLYLWVPFDVQECTHCIIIFSCPFIMSIDSWYSVFWRLVSRDRFHFRVVSVIFVYYSPVAFFLSVIILELSVLFQLSNWTCWQITQLNESCLSGLNKEYENKDKIPSVLVTRKHHPTIVCSYIFQIYQKQKYD